MSLSFASVAKTPSTYGPLDVKPGKTFDEYFSMSKAEIDGLMAGWVESAARSYAYQAGLSPVKARLIYSALSAEQIVRFFYVIQTRGMKIDRIAGKAGLAGDIINWGRVNLKIKARGGGAGTDGTAKSLMGLMVVFSDVNTFLRERIGPQILGLEKYEGLEVKYQWNGSMSCFYNAAEEACTTEDQWVAYYCKVIVMHEHFADWYVAVRREAAKAQGRARATGDEASAVTKYKERIVASRGYYEAQLQSFDLATRKTWHSGAGHKGVQGALTKEQKSAIAKVIVALNSYTATLTALPGKDVNAYKPVYATLGIPWV